MKRNTKIKKLLVITPDYFSFVKDQVDILSTRFEEINVLVRYNPLAEISSILPLHSLKIKRLDYIINTTGTPKNVHVFPAPVYYFPLFKSQVIELGNKLYKTIEKIIEQENIQFDCIHAHFTWPEGYAGMQLKFRSNKPLVITAHGYDIYDLPFRDIFWRNRISTILNSADSVITVSQNNKKCIDNLKITTKTDVIYNGFKSDLFYPQNTQDCRKMLKLPLDKKIILTVGNLEPIKGHIYLINAIKKLICSKKDILCIIIGEGKIRNSLYREITKNDLRNFIWMVGAKKHEEIPLWINASDIFSLPSIKESFGVAQIEAMACGKPVVATKNGGSEELILSSNVGILAENQNSEDLTKQLIIALGKSWDPMKINAYAMRYNWIDITQQIEGIYAALSQD
jgi:glycosyltransferase involved in cell wall biosynthesis